MGKKPWRMCQTLKKTLPDFWGEYLFPRLETKIPMVDHLITGYPLVNVYITMERSPMLLMGKLTISMAIFNSFLYVYQRVHVHFNWLWLGENIYRVWRNSYRWCFVTFTRGNWVPGWSTRHQRWYWEEMGWMEVPLYLAVSVSLISGYMIILRRAPYPNLWGFKSHDYSPWTTLHLQVAALELSGTTCHTMLLGVFLFKMWNSQHFSTIWWCPYLWDRL